MPRSFPPPVPAPRRVPAVIALSLALALAPAARANDTAAELATGGLIPKGTPEVEMAREVLTISAQRITVDYVFRNTSPRDVTTMVAFPLPDVTGAPDLIETVPYPERDNFLDFTVTQDGKPVTPQLLARASLSGRDITAELAAKGIPLNPLGPATTTALAALPDAVAEDWEKRGLIEQSSYDAGQGWVSERLALWTVARSYYWTTTFPAGRDVAVSHRYTPSVGGTVAVTFAGEPSAYQREALADYRKRYCMDDTFERAVTRRLAKGPMTESWISYVLGTGGNWAGGRTGDFTLRVDKGRPDALVSFCGEGVRKTGPTSFEMHATDFKPPPRLDILILNPAG